MGKGGKAKGKKSSAEQYRELVAAHMTSRPPGASSQQNQGRVVKRSEPRRVEVQQQRLHVAHERLESIQDMFTTSRRARNLVHPYVSRGGSGGGSGYRNRGRDFYRGRGSAHGENRRRGYSSPQSSLYPSPSLLVTGSDTRYVSLIHSGKGAEHLGAYRKFGGNRSFALLISKVNKSPVHYQESETFSCAGEGLG